MNRRQKPRRRSRPGRSLTLAVVLLGTIIRTSPLPAAPEPSEALDWRRDPEPGSLLAVDDDRPLLLYFTAAWCGPCRLLEREVFSHPAGLAELSRYNLVRLDLDSANGRAVADSSGVQTLPAFILLTSDGREIERLYGYRSRRLLLRDLERFRTGAGTLADLQGRLDARPDDVGLRLALGLRHAARQQDTMAVELMTSVFDALFGAVTGPHGFLTKQAVSDTLVAEAARALARLHWKNGQPDAAARVLEDLLRGWPDHPFRRATWRLLADFRREGGDAAGAVDALRDAAMIEPERADFLSDYAAAAAGLGHDLASAETAARRAVALTNRDDASIMAVLAQVLRERRRYPEAMLWIKRAEATSPDDPRWPQLRNSIRRSAIEGN